jgi:FHA domain-containing protein
VAIFIVARRRGKKKELGGTPAPAGSLRSPGLAHPAMPDSVPAGSPAPHKAAPPPPPPPAPPPPPPPMPPPVVMAGDQGMTVDLSRTIALTDSDVPKDFGSIKFVSGPLSGQKFQIRPEGDFIGRDGGSSQIVIGDPRISKKHVWIGVRAGRVVIEDQNSRNGTFVNDPKSERVTEMALKSGDTVILGESDVARFEFHA